MDLSPSHFQRWCPWVALSARVMAVDATSMIGLYFHAFYPFGRAMMDE
jgi:hypothetical protein